MIGMSPRAIIGDCVFYEKGLDYAMPQRFFETRF